MKMKKMVLAMVMCLCMVFCSVHAMAAEDGLERLDNTIGQNVGDVADFGWNAYNANYTIKEIKDGIVWFGSNDTSVFHETWFWTKEGENVLQDWTWTTYVKPVADTQGGCFVQLMFGTAAVGGRYSLLIDPAGGGYVQLYRDGMIANSWEEAMGATMKLGTGKEVELATNQPVKVSIYHKAEADGKGHITVCMNDVRVMETAIDNAAVGDYGLWLDAGMDAWFGSPVVTKGCTVQEKPDTGTQTPGTGEQNPDDGNKNPQTSDLDMTVIACAVVVGMAGLTVLYVGKKRTV